MSSRIKLILSRLDRHILKLWFIIVCASALLIQFPTGAQTDCTSYNQCAALQGEQNTKLNGNISFSFDEASLSAAFGGDASKIQDFRNRMTAAANDWAAKTGRSISPASAGQAGNVTIKVSSEQVIREKNGEVSIDSNNSSRRVMTFSDEFNGFSSAGKDRLASHEWGHVLGLRDVPYNGPNSCPGVQTVMRQVGPDAIGADAQLRNGYTCETSGGPGTCPENLSLPQPPRPTACDEAKAETIHPPPTPACPDNDRDGYTTCARDCRDDVASINPGASPACTTTSPTLDRDCNDVPDREQCGTAPPPKDGGGGCPILIDVSGDGFDLTGGAGGVLFDLNSDGIGEGWSWTATASDDAWLVLDRNGNGQVDNGMELFGNFTPQPPVDTPHGFLALAEFDKVEDGGNGDGVIDSEDAIFTSLRLWQDTNHNGASEPGELHTLPALDVVRLHLDYRESRRVDSHGNQFKYRAKVRDSRGARVGRWAWDVFLVPGQ